MHFLENKHGAEVANKAAWILSSLIGHIPGQFTESQVSHVLTAIQVSDCSEIGNLDAIVNLLKADTFRSIVWCPKQQTVKQFILSPVDDSTNTVYKSVFGIWILSGDAEIVKELKDLHIVKKLRGMLMNCRAEKVVRLTLLVLRNFLNFKPLCEDMVETNVLEAVQSLEYEKWRDAELYDDIREMSNLISNEVQSLSNLEKYIAELSSGNLKAGYVHTSTFWGQNVMKMDKDDFKAIKVLSAVLVSPTSSVETLALACSDVGHFVALHPMGKKKVADFSIKDRIMVLMAAGGDEKREVRREALLCCQKIMLNKWQEVDKAK
jgi:V-type H+-transporting ATPase subunit H